MSQEELTLYEELEELGLLEEVPYYVEVRL